jgi:hypothetical protein
MDNFVWVDLQTWSKIEQALGPTHRAYHDRHGYPRVQAISGPGQLGWPALVLYQGEGHTKQIIFINGGLNPIAAEQQYIRERNSHAKG